MSGTFINSNRKGGGRGKLICSGLKFFPILSVEITIVTNSQLGSQNGLQLKDVAYVSFKFKKIIS